MNRTILIASAAVLPLAGCAAYPDYQLVAYGLDRNYLTYDHPSTEKATAQVLASAERLCAERKQVAIQTARICSPTKCTTNYQCVDAADVIKYGL